MLRKGNTTLLLLLVLVIGGGIWASQQGIIELPEGDQTEGDQTSSGDSCEYTCLAHGECMAVDGKMVSGSCDVGSCCKVD